ncbi:unnamed protein product, partial [Thlaspi arvense]
GDRIPATIEKEHVKPFANEITEGRVVFINTFKVAELQGDYRTTRSHYKILFYLTTSVEKFSDFLVNVKELSFKRLTIVLSHDYDRRYLFDVIGQIVDVSNIQETKNQGISRSMLKIRHGNTEFV